MEILSNYLVDSLGLHEEVKIIFVVNGYEAQFYTKDGDTLIETGFGKTIEGAIKSLGYKLFVLGWKRS